MQPALGKAVRVLLDVPRGNVSPLCPVGGRALRPQTEAPGGSVPVLHQSAQRGGHSAQEETARTGGSGAGSRELTSIHHMFFYVIWSLYGQK